MIARRPLAHDAAPMAKRANSPTLQDLLGVIEEMAPAALAESYDNPGLQIGDRMRPVKRILTALEVTDAVIGEAKRRRAGTIVAHHPLFFLPIKRLDESDLVGHLARRLVREEIALVAAHTNLDKSPEGTGPALARRLGLKSWETLLPEAVGSQFKYVVFVPVGHERKVIDAIAKAGGGVIGDYDHCTFRTPGTGTFRGNEKTNPTIGKAGRFEQAEEFRLEAAVPKPRLAAVIEAVRAAHPYEEVAFDVYPLETPPGPWGLGVRATLEKKTTLRDWAQHVKRRLKVKSVKLVGDPKQAVRTVALGTGACAFLIRQLAPPQVDCLVTGDVTYHLAVEAKAKGLGVIDAGHWATEVGIAKPLAEALAKRLKARGLTVEVAATEAPDADPLVTI